MLQTLGVNAKITQMHRGGARMMPLNDGSGAKAEFDVQPLYRLLINSVDSQKLLQLGLYCRRLKIAHREPQRAAAQFVAVMDVVNTYRRDDTYCVTEPKRHMAVFNGILTGNCTEITLNTKPSTVEDPDSGETAVCNIGSINLANHILPDGQINTVKLARTVGIAMRMLDNVIDLTMYTVPKARRSNQTHRPVGLGMMGFQDCLFKLRIPYASQEAVAFADKSMELISFHAISASVELSKERGAYASFKGSLWDQGILPVDSQRLLSAERGDVYIETNFETFLGEAAWADLRKQIQTYGMRNSNCMAIAPTATIGNIVGVEASIEPCFANVSVKSNLSGEFTVVNEYLVKDFKQLGIWDEALLADLKYYGGSVQQIARVPDELKRLYQTAFEVGAFWLIDAAARRQKWIDQAQSLNIYIGSKPTGKMLDETYKHAWLKGLKTTYYLRALQATNAESSTGRIGALNAVPSAPASPPMGLASPQKVVEPTSVFIPQLQAVAMPEPEGAACMYRPGDPEFASCDVCQ
jgi:ribonucleoside-diphosphate reductase alpha chain